MGWAVSVREDDFSTRKVGKAGAPPVRKAGARDGAARDGHRDGHRDGQRDGHKDADPYRQIWQGMLAHLRQHYPSMCRQWFHELVPLGISGGALEMRTSTVLHRDYLRRQCADAFNDAARTASGRLLSVRFLGPDDPSSKDDGLIDPPAPASAPVSSSVAAPAAEPLRVVEVEPPAAPRDGPTLADAAAREAALPREGGPSVWGAPPASQGPAPGGPGPSGPAPRSRVVVHEGPHRYQSLVVNPDYSFENFVVGPNNRLAHAAALAIAANPGRSYNPFFVHGGVGLGKTHLLQAMCLRVHQHSPQAVIHYTSCEEFVTQYIDSVQAGTMADFRHRYRDVDMLIIDDIHFLTKRGRSQEEFFHTFNSLFQQQRQIIVSSDAAPEEIPDLEERLVSRFKWGLVAKIDAPDYESRIQILKTKAKLRGLVMPDDVAQLVASKIDRNIRELEGAVVELQVRAMVENSPLTLEIAKVALGERPAPPDTVYEPTIQTIIGVICDFYGIRLADLQSKQRNRSIALPRHMCMYFARKCTRLSLEEIGGFFGGRDHTTVMHAVKTVEERLEENESFRATAQGLEQRIRTPRV